MTKKSMDNDNQWQRKSIAYRLFGIGRPKVKLTPEQRKQRMKESFDTGPAGVWVKILGLGPVGKKVAIGLGVLAWLIFLFGGYMFPKP